MVIKKLILLMLLTFVLCSCATMFGNNSDVLTIRSNDPEALLNVNGNPIGKGNAQYILNRGDDAILSASKKGCSDRNASVNKKMVGATFLNLLFWPGFLIDLATGAMMKASPKDYTINAMCEI